MSIHDAFYCRECGCPLPNHSLNCSISAALNKAEIARLRASHAELLAALKSVMAEYEDGYGLRCVKQVHAAIAIAEKVT